MKATKSNNIKKSREFNKKAVIEALVKTLGIVSTACKLVGIDRTTFYKWYNKDIAFKAEVDELENITIDFAESQLHQQIKNGNTTATIFYLKCKGKKRGYIDSVELQHTGEVKTNLEVIVNTDTIKDKIKDVLNGIENE